MRLPTVLLTVLLAATTTAQAQSQDPIRIGQPNWFAGELISMILSDVIQEEFDVPVEFVLGSNPEIYGGMLSDTPTIDIHADTWLPNQSNWVNPGLESGARALSQSNYPGVDGICVPQYVLSRNPFLHYSQL